MFANSTHTTYLEPTCVPTTMRRHKLNLFPAGMYWCSRNHVLDMCVCVCVERVPVLSMSMCERKRGTEEHSRDATCSVYSPSPGRFDRNTERMTQSLGSPDISRRFRSTLVFPANLPALSTTSVPVADVLWTGAPIHRFW